MNRLLLLAAAMVVAAPAGPRPKWQRLADGVVVTARGVHVRLRACSDRIVRVTAWPGGAPEPSRPSLAVGAHWAPTRFDVRADGRQAVLSTPRLRARVALDSGQVSFEDASGRPLLREHSAGGQAFRRVTTQGETTYEVSQSFETRDDEGLYGLGQHQDRSLDLRGRDLDLWQHNREIVIPTLVSSRGWGLLWDNPSHMRFGSPEDVVSVPAQSLMDETGRPGGLTAAYFADRDLREPLGAPAPGLPDASMLPPDIAPKIRAVRWTGSLVP